MKALAQILMNINANLHLNFNRTPTRTLGRVVFVTKKRPIQVTNYTADAGNVRWHPSDEWLFSISNGKVYASYVGSSDGYGRSILLTPDDLNREALVVSPDGKILAYTIDLPNETASRIIEGEQNNIYKQIFILELRNALTL